MQEAPVSGNLGAGQHPDQIAFVALWFLVFVVPMENIVVIDGVGTVSRVIGGFTFVLGTMVVLWQRRDISLSPMSSTFALFFYWSVMTCLWSINIDRSLQAIWSLFQLFVLVWLVWMFGRSATRQMWLMISYVLGGYVATVGTLWAYLSGAQSSYLRYAADGFNPNDLGLTLAIGVPFAWHIATSRQQVAIRLLAVCYIPVATLAIVLTASRTAFIALALAAVYVVCSSGSLKARVRWAVAVVVPPIVVMVYKMAPQSSWARISSISEELASADLNSRVSIWRDGFEAFTHQPFFGFGAGTFPAALEQYSGYANASHNLFLSILVGQGIVGLVLFFLMLVIALRQISQMERSSRLLWIGVGAVWLAGVMTLSWELRKPTWLLLALIANQAAIDNNGLAGQPSTDPQRNQAT